MAITFRTIEELVEILESRGVKTDEDTARAIERESYYAIVNGYKKPFLDTEKMTESSDDVYKEDTEFRWIYDLFMFDRDLRAITFKYLTRCEAIMRTAVAYSFCHHHPEQDAYLNESNFCNSSSYLVPGAFSGNKARLHQRNLDKLMSILHGKISLDNTTHEFIRHYVRKYSTVPLWVLANDLTFGNVVHFYQLMQVNDRREACRIIAKASHREPSRGHLTERKLLRAANVLNHFRNLCAHDERLYCAKSGNDDFSTMATLMGEVLPFEEVNDFVHEFIDLIAKYEGRLHGISPYDLIAAMGFSEPSSE